MSEPLRVGDFLLAMEGLAILRAWGTDMAEVRARAEEIVSIAENLDQEPYCRATAVPEYEVADGYRAWAATYDCVQNILIEVEERAVHPLLTSLPPGRALDAACGTGRHARWLAERGHQVIGIDASEEMLAVARAKAPGAEFRTGDLAALGLPDDSADLVICALALSHLPALDGAIAELARVLAPEGRLVLSDIHPLKAALGLHAFFRDAAGARGCIRNRFHPISAYLAAFTAANLAVVHCIEVPWDEQTIAAQPVYPLIPAALETALRGLALLLVWELRTH